jgi:hypothetical protein
MQAKRAVLSAAATTVVLVAALFGYSRWRTPAPHRARTALMTPSNSGADDAQARADLAAMKQEVQLVRAQLVGLQEQVGNVTKSREAAQPVADTASRATSTSSKLST